MNGHAAHLREANNEQGLYRKFDVRRTDGSDAPGGKHAGCDYFVLDLTHDPLAKAAAQAYANTAEATHHDLARDMRERYGLAGAEDARDAAREPRHRYVPHDEYPWFCGACGYPEHEALKHLPLYAAMSDQNNGNV